MRNRKERERVLPSIFEGVLAYIKGICVNCWATHHPILLTEMSRFSSNVVCTGARAVKLLIKGSNLASSYIIFNSIDSVIGMRSQSRLANAGNSYVHKMSKKVFLENRLSIIFLQIFVVGKHKIQNLSDVMLLAVVPIWVHHKILSYSLFGRFSHNQYNKCFRKC